MAYGKKKGYGKPMTKPKPKPKGKK